MQLIRNQKGQSLIEYVILVALVAVATIGLVRMLQVTVKVNLANTVHALRGANGKKEAHESMTKDDLRKVDFSDFVNGSASKSK